MLLVRLSGMPSSGEVTSYARVRNCGSSKFLVYGEKINCVAARHMGDASEGSEESGSEIW